MTGKSTKEEHASDETKASQTGTVAESRADKGIKPSATEDHAPQKGQEREGEKKEEKDEKSEEETKAAESESKSDEPTEKEVEESTEKAIVRSAHHG